MRRGRSPRLMTPGATLSTRKSSNTAAGPCGRWATVCWSSLAASSTRFTARSRSRARCRNALSMCRPSGRSASGWASISAMCSATAKPSTATASRLPPGWRASPNRVASTSAARCATRCATSCRSALPIWDSMRWPISRARCFSVIARNTAFSYKGKGVDAKQISRALGVHYVLEGSLRKAGTRVRISCQLVDTASGQHLWAERFDGTLEDSFDLQDRITESVIGAVGPVLRGAEIDRIGRKPAASQDAYDLTLRAMFPAFAETDEENEVALRLLGEAIETNPGYPTANALAAWCHQQRHMLAWPSAQDDDPQTAKLLARTAISGGADVPLALALAGA